MDVFPGLLLILFYGGLFLLLVYLIIKRIKDKKSENFEQRDN